MAKISQILIVEDEGSIRRVLKNILEQESEFYRVDTANDGAQGLDMIKSKNYDLVISDIKMPVMDGEELLVEAKKYDPHCVFVMISGHGDIETAVNTMRLGAYDYISKPPDLNRLLTTVRNALNTGRLVAENTVLKKKVSKQYQIIGQSQGVKNIMELIQKVAPTDARVLITGSNGTGKELVAHQIHLLSARSQYPLVEVNCAAIPSELIESELFGHVKGAFTSAVKDKAGKFEMANKGTIFLDEIGDMSLSAQAKVLRALQENVITPVGADKDITIDVRVIAATNKDLKNEIKEGRFREDLYHRLAVILIHVPDLNQRKDDIPLLIEHFVHQIAQEQGTGPKEFSQQAIALLMENSFTGNIRELRNVVERLIILGSKIVSDEDVEMFAK